MAKEKSTPSPNYSTILNPDKQSTLLEILVKTSYLTQVTLPSDKEFKNPLEFGSGFIVTYNDHQFFVTADHVLHPDDYRGDEEIRTGIDYNISVFNNVNLKDDFLSTYITPLGGFYYMEQFDLDKPDKLHELVDITACLMKPINFQQPFLTEKVVFIGETIQADEPKWTIKSECFNSPDPNENYLVFGKINTRIEGIQLKSEPTLKENLRYIRKVGDYLLFNTEEIISKKEVWAGLSGSPILSSKGDCVGVVSSVNLDSKSVYIMPIDKVKMLLEVIFQQENLDQSNG